MKQTKPFRDALSRGVKRARAEKPEYAAACDARVKAFWDTPETAAKLMEAAKSPAKTAHLNARNKDPKHIRRLHIAAARGREKKRGFRVPHHLEAEYRRLTVSKKLSAAEAGRVLGIVRGVPVDG